MLHRCNTNVKKDIGFLFKTRLDTLTEMNVIKPA